MAPAALSNEKNQELLTQGGPWEEVHEQEEEVVGENEIDRCVGSSNRHTLQIIIRIILPLLLLSSHLKPVVVAVAGFPFPLLCPYSRNVLLAVTSRWYSFNV